MRFYFNTEPFTGMTDAISIQAIGLYGDDRFVIEADTEEEATQKFIDLLKPRQCRACEARSLFSTEDARSS